MPKLSIIIPWSNRPEIKKTLLQNRAIFQNYDLEIIVVCCAGDFDQLQELFVDHYLPEVRWLNLPNEHFNKSLALNIGGSVARSDKLFFLDTDVLLKYDFLAEALHVLDGSTFVTVDRVFESHPTRRVTGSRLKDFANSIEFVTDDERVVRVERNRIRFSDGSRSAPGLILLSKAHFYQVQGMNAELKRWGWEDIDLMVRLQLLLGLERRQLGAVVHLSHGDDVRNLVNEPRPRSEFRNSSISMANYQQGNYYGTYQQNIKQWKDFIKE
ncbi:MAG: glycosyltransferase family 2 protein [Anaerolineae bacterium]|nr:glycosyltransferase family 2 protein [Anaerolineae bacterium]